MKRIFTLILLAGAMLAGLNAQTVSRWVAPGSSAVANDGSRNYIDTKTLRWQKDSVIFWLRRVKVDGSSELTRFEMSRNHFVRALSGVSYDAQGKTTDSNSIPGNWNEIIPDSIGDGVYDYLYPVIIKSEPLPAANRY